MTKLHAQRWLDTTDHLASTLVTDKTGDQPQLDGHNAEHVVQEQHPNERTIGYYANMSHAEWRHFLQRIAQARVERYAEDTPAHHIGYISL